MSCPPGNICLQNSHAMILFFLLLIAAFYVYTKCNNKDILHSIQMDQNMKELKHMIDIQKEKESSDKSHIYNNTRNKIDESSNKLQEEEINPLNYIEPKNRINIPTRGPMPKIQQIGILTKINHISPDGPGSDADAHILPLMGRKTYNRSHKYYYYTTFNGARLPLTYKNKLCTSEHGCDELYTNDIIGIPELNGSFKATLYENENMYYIPEI